MALSDLRRSAGGDVLMHLAATRLPPELCRRIIHHYLSGLATRMNRNTTEPRHHLTADPSIPPSNGSCPLLKLPCEIRRHVLNSFLPAKDVTIHPSTGMYNPKSRTCDLLTLNKALSDELLEVLYEERTFVINIHEGLFTGGAEFLNSGLQRLQYRRSFTDSYFKRFEEGNAKFGFRRLKRIIFVIHPCKDSRTKTNRHDPMLTYFNICAMLKLLKKAGRSELNYVEIVFSEFSGNVVDAATPVGRDAVMRNDQYWWNPELNAPRETSVHGVPNVELILRAFMRLDKVHHLKIELPLKLRHDVKTKDFVNRLHLLLCGKGDVLDSQDHDLIHKLDVARDALDEWVFQCKFGNTAVLDRDVWIDLGKLALEFEDEDCPPASKRLRGCDKLIDDMSEEEQMRWAVERSMRDARIRPTKDTSIPTSTPETKTKTVSEQQHADIWARRSSAIATARRTYRINSSYQHHSRSGSSGEQIVGAEGGDFMITHGHHYQTRSSIFPIRRSAFSAQTSSSGLADDDGSVQPQSQFPWLMPDQSGHAFASSPRRQQSSNFESSTSSHTGIIIPKAPLSSTGSNDSTDDHEYSWGTSFAPQDNNHPHDNPWNLPYHLRESLRESLRSDLRTSIAMSSANTGPPSATFVPSFDYTSAVFGDAAVNRGGDPPAGVKDEDML